MTALLLLWEIDTEPWRGVYARDIDRVRHEGSLRKPWTVPITSAADAGTDVWLVAIRSGGARYGLIGHGILATADRSSVDPPVVDERDTGSATAEDEDNDDDSPDHEVGESKNTALVIDFDLLLERGDEVLLKESSTYVIGAQARILTADEASALRRLWTEALAVVPGSVDPRPGSLPATAVRGRAVNRFETDPDLRGVVLAHHGAVCHGCDLDVEQRYGIAGMHVMQLHLVTPVHLIGDDFAPDVLVDLVPLCPTCHVVAHTSAPDALSVRDLRELLRASGFLRGSVVTERELEAQDSARRILGAGT